MGHPERPDRDRPPEREQLSSNHFYAAYVFDLAETRQAHIAILLEEAQRFGYPVRYWWLSQAADIQNDPDRLIICVHHPSHDENAGMDLYDALKARQVTYDDLDAAVLEEYVGFGVRANQAQNILKPDGNVLFPTKPLEVRQSG